MKNIIIINGYIIRNRLVWYNDKDWKCCNPLMIFINNKQAIEWAKRN